MSNVQVVESRLDNCLGPFFGASVLQLHTVFASLSGHIEKHELVDAAETVRGYQHAENVAWGSDAYVGLVTLTFAVSGGLVFIRFARFHDASWEDGTLTDRCTAAYSSRESVPRYEIDRVADGLRKRLAMHPTLRGLTVVPGLMPELILNG